MTKLEKLDSEELSTLRDWFRNYDAEVWDRQIEKDVREGKLDKLAEEAIAAHVAGRTMDGFPQMFKSELTAAFSF